MNRRAFLRALVGAAAAAIAGPVLGETRALRGVVVTEDDLDLDPFAAWFEVAIRHAIDAVISIDAPAIQHYLEREAGDCFDCIEVIDAGESVFEVQARYCRPMQMFTFDYGIRRAS